MMSPYLFAGAAALAMLRNSTRVLGSPVFFSPSRVKVVAILSLSVSGRMTAQPVSPQAAFVPVAYLVLREL